MTANDDADQTEDPEQGHRCELAPYPANEVEKFFVGPSYAKYVRFIFAALGGKAGGRGQERRPHDPT
jgi:hypothetical protein